MPSKKNNLLAVVVEDDEALRSMIQELLEATGFETIGAANGDEGLRAVQEFRPSVITLDLHMPGMDGVEVLDRLALDEFTAAVPVVVVSAYSSDRRLSCRKQIRAVLTKPFDVDDLCRTVWRAANPPICSVA